ncbi:hypothetical protein Alg215_09252 [Pyrenophora tritici-repentis]|nr:hypothetical protein Alg215_09252 [Pyrenophora tritici-repentis]
MTVIGAITALLVAPLLVAARTKDFTCAIYYDHELTQDAATNNAINHVRDAIAASICYNQGGDRISPADTGVVNGRLPNVCSLCRNLDAGARANIEESHPDRAGGPLVTYTYRCGEFAPGSCQYS